MFYFVFTKKDLISLNIIIPTNPKKFGIDKYSKILIDTIKKTKQLLKTFCFSMGANKNDSPSKTFLTNNNLGPRSEVKHGGYIERRRAKINFIFRKRIIEIVKYFITKVNERSC